MENSIHKTSSPTNFIHQAGIFVCCVIAYIALSRFTPLLFISGTNVTPVWPSSGFALGLLILLGIGIWPAITIGSFVSMLWILLEKQTGSFSDAMIVSTISSIGNTIEVLAAFILIKRYSSVDKVLDTARNVAMYLIIVTQAGTIGACICSLIMFIFNTHEIQPLLDIFVTAWISDVAGFVTITPLMLFWVRKSDIRITSKRIVEGIFTFGLLIVACLGIFDGKFEVLYLYKYEYAIIPMLIWITFRLGRRMVVLAIIIVKILAISGIVLGKGPFIEASTNVSILVAQFFLAIISATMLVLSARTKEVIEKQEALSREIADRVETETKLVENRNLYRTLIDSIPQSVYFKDLDGRFISANESCAEANGITALQIEGKTDFDLYPAAIAEKHKASDSQVLLLGETIGFLECEEYNGKKRWLKKFKTPVRDKQGAIVGVLGINWDVTDQKLVEDQIRNINEELEKKVHERTRELEQKTEELDRFFTVALDLLCIANDNGVFVRVNKAWETVLGYSTTELEGRRFFDFIHPEDIQATQETLTTLSSKTEVWNFVNRYRCKNGDYRWIEWRSTPVGDKIYAAARDITQQREASEKLVAALDKADRASRAKSEFLANMSHEIRTPLNAIIGFSELISVQSKEEGMKKYTSSILTAGRALLRIINDILDLSKIESGMMTAKPELTDLRMILNEIEQIFGQKIAEKELLFSYDIASNVPRFLMLDEVRIRQVLLNLVGNAVKFTDTGSITIVVALLDQSADKKAVYLDISVHDTGMGIPFKEQSAIFEPFRQQSGQSARFGGTGLGLSISRRLVEMMNGTITVESSPGAGSVFHVQLKSVAIAPVISGEHRENPESLLPVLFDKATVLIADDVESNRDVLSAHLSNVGLDVVQADNGQTVLVLAKELKPKLIIIDIHMPVLSGMDVVRILKADSCLAKIPVIALTASYKANGEEDLIKKNFDAVLTKPVAMTKLLKVLGTFLPVHSTGSVLDPVQETTSTDIVFPENISESVKKLIGPLVYDLSGTIVMEQVRNLAEKLRNVGTEHSLKPVIDLADDLGRYADGFDITKIKQCIYKLKKVVESPV